MSERVVYRVRCSITGEWKLRDFHTGEPSDFATAAEARKAAQNVKYWRVVKVTIRKRIADKVPR